MFERRGWAGKVVREGGKRLIALPDELVLEGEDIEIVQDCGETYRSIRTARKD